MVFTYYVSQIWAFLNKEFINARRGAPHHNPPAADNICEEPLLGLGECPNFGCHQKTTFNNESGVVKKTCPSRSTPASLRNPLLPGVLAGHVSIIAFIVLSDNPEIILVVEKMSVVAAVVLPNRPPIAAHVLHL